MDLSLHIQDVLIEAIKTLFPLYDGRADLVKRHAWRDRKYVGTFNGKVLAWAGFSANLATVDSRYRAIFVDVVDNILPQPQRIEHYGQPFADAIEGLSRFVVMFVLDFPANASSNILSHGFVPRTLGSGRVIHACCIASIEEFLSVPALYWSAQIVRLVLLQRFLSIHRKPFSEGEVPLQNLLFQTGYLHSYIVNGGLELHKLSKPRRAGDFGHDFHAVVSNPFLPEYRPLPLGIELYVGAIGYHLTSIPRYVNEFGLRGIVVVAKDDPLPSLRAANLFGLPPYDAQRLVQLGNPDAVGIHHLPLNKVVADLSAMRDKLEELIPVVRFVSGA